jgi:methylglutaconyl-CoA hydratase
MSDTSTDLIQLSVEDGIALFELNRPDKRNALSVDLIAAVHAALDAIDLDTTRVLILGGAGKSFCAGMDLHGVLDDPEAMGGMLRGLAHAMQRIRRLPMPTIARVQGAAVGGGCGLAVVCDLAVSHAEARLGYPEVHLGVCPAVVAPWLMRKVGAGPARAMLLQGGTMTGTEALAQGMIDRVVERDVLDATVLEMAQELAKGGQQAMAVTKQWLNKLDGSLEDEPLARAAELSAQVIGSIEAQTRLRRILGD